MTRVHRALAVVATALAVAALCFDFGSSAGAVALASAPLDPGDYVSAPEVAARIVGQDAMLIVIDVRSRQDFEQLHVAGATHMTLDDLGRQPIPHDARIVLYANDDARALKGLRLLRMRGYQKVAILREGLYEWIGRVLDPRLATDATPVERAEFDRAVQLSRFFGGMPRSGVSRSELPRGYWTGAPAAKDGSRELLARQAIAGVRRRGC
jgi:rhodanese-related sulfurtransferase